LRVADLIDPESKKELGFGERGRRGKETNAFDGLGTVIFGLDKISGSRDWTTSRGVSAELYNSTSRYPDIRGVGALRLISFSAATLRLSVENKVSGFR
jgi:hypothetical protein